MKTSSSGLFRVLWVYDSGETSAWGYILLAPSANKIVKMKITGASGILASKTGPGDPASYTEWAYSASEVKVTVASGIQTYAAVSGGVSLSGTLYNRLESGNRSVTGTAAYGNGVARSELDTETFVGYLHSIPNIPVDVELLKDSEGTQVGLFSMPNAVGGECEE
jgi:hypothetical protein